MNNTLIQSRDGARGGLGDYIPRGSMLAPLSEGEKLCFQTFGIYSTLKIVF